MPYKKKVAAQDLINLLPRLSILSRTPNGVRRDKQIDRLTSSQKDILCQCLKWTKNLVPEKKFSKSQLKRISNDSEAIEFLIALTNCSKEKRSRLIKKRDKLLKQTGRGFGLYLGSILPAVCGVLSSKQ